MGRTGGVQELHPADPAIPPVRLHDMRYIWLIPLLPGIGAAINGLIGIRSFSRKTGGRGRVHDDDARRSALSLFAFWQLLGLPADARAFDVTVADWIPRIPLATNNGVGLFQVHLGIPPRSAVRDDAADRHRHRHADSRLLDGVHGRRAARRRRAVLLLSEPVLLLHAHARPGKQLPGDVRGLGGRRPLLVPADRLLVREEERGRRRQEGVHHQPRRRLGLRPRRLPDLLHVRHARFPRRAERRGGACRSRPRTSACCRSSACSCSSARPARARRFRSTSGCRTRWKGRRRCPR